MPASITTAQADAIAKIAIDAYDRGETDYEIAYCIYTQSPSLGIKSFSPSDALIAATEIIKLIERERPARRGSSTNQQRIDIL